MKHFISVIALIVVSAAFLAGCGAAASARYELSGIVPLKYKDGSEEECDLSGCVLTVDAARAYPAGTHYKDRDISYRETEIKLLIEITVKHPEDWTDEKRAAFADTVRVEASYADGKEAYDTYSVFWPRGETHIRITLTHAGVYGDEVFCAVTANGEKVEGGEFKLKLY